MSMTKRQPPSLSAFYPTTERAPESKTGQTPVKQDEWKLMR